MMHGAMFPQFLGISGWVKGKTFPAVLTAGRDPDCDVRFPENSAASRRHFLTRVSDGQTYIRDLNSTNGTYVNGARMSKGSERALDHVDIVKIDDCRFVYLERAETAARTKAAAAGEAERIRRMATIRHTSLEEVVAAAPKDMAVAFVQLASDVNNLRASSAIVERAVNGIFDMIRMRRLAVLLTGHSPEVFRSELYHDLDTGSTDSFEMNRAIRRQALQLRIPLLSNDGDSVLCLPLVTVDEAPLGIIYIQDPDPQAFNLATQTVLSGIADVVAPALRNALEREWLQAENERLQQESQDNGGSRTMIGSSPRMQAVQQMIAQVAPTDITVLITGENGSGKEVAAHAIHDNSPRRRGPFVDVNCGAIADELRESELFGHERGSFTGATAQRIGQFELANGGTLFLDEIGETSPKLQVALLRVIQERQIQRVGGSRKIPVDVRLIVATNRNLEEMVREASFRQDLYYRLKVVQLRMPSLAERREDLIHLANYFIQKHAVKMNKAIVGLAFGAEQILLQHDWKGNVRELENTIMAAIVFAGCDRITRENLRRVLEEPSPVDFKPEDTLESFVESAQRWIIQRRLEDTNGDCNVAADLLGVHRTTLARLMKQFGIG